MTSPSSTRRTSSERAICTTTAARSPFIPRLIKPGAVWSHPLRNQWMSVATSLRRSEPPTNLRSSYCSLAHGQILVDKFLEPSVVEDLVEDPGSAGLDDAETLIVQFAVKVADDASTITEADIDRLRTAGFSDRDIFDVVLAAAARCFFSKVLDATGTLADAVLPRDGSGASGRAHRGSAHRQRILRFLFCSGCFLTRICQCRFVCWEHGHGRGFPTIRWMGFSVSLFSGVAVFYAEICKLVDRC